MDHCCALRKDKESEVRQQGSLIYRCLWPIFKRNTLGVPATVHGDWSVVLRGWRHQVHRLRPPHSGDPCVAGMLATGEGIQVWTSQTLRGPRLSDALGERARSQQRLETIGVYAAT